MNRAQRQPDFQNIAQEKMRKAVQGAVSVRKSTKNLSTSLAEKQRGTENFLPRFDQYQNIVSPNFSLDSEKAAVRHERISGFSNFGTGLAFGFAMMLLLVLVFQLGWLFSDDIREMAGLHRGIVAGASDERIKNASFSETSASGYIATQTAEAKEIISLSRVLLKAAMERDSEQGSTSSEAPRSDIGGHGADNDQ